MAKIYKNNINNKQIKLKKCKDESIYIKIQNLKLK